MHGDALLGAPLNPTFTALYFIVRKLDGYLTSLSKQKILRLLWLKTELLHPVDKGGKIRTYQMLKELKREHRITYLTLDDEVDGVEKRELASEYCHELICVPHRTRPKFSPGFYMELVLNLTSKLPYFMKKYRSEGMTREIVQLASRSAFDLIVCDFLPPSVNLPSDLNAPTILFQHNVEAMIWKRHYEVQKNPLKKLYLYGQWRKSLTSERETCRRFDQVVAVSQEDRDATRRDYGVERVADVPTGVDTDYFRPRSVRQPHPRNLVFTGSMDWLPNEDAIQYFIKEIFPSVKRSLPDTTLTVVGRNPFPGLVELARRDPSIIVTGRVDDVRPYMEKAAAFVVPLRIGGGTRLKIFEAMAMEMPVISTTIGAEGLPVLDGAELLLADTPGTFADAILKVLNDDVYARELGARAANLVRERFSWNKVAPAFVDICLKTIERYEQLHPAAGRTRDEGG